MVRLIALMLLSFMAGCSRGSFVALRGSQQAQVDPTFYKSSYSGRSISDPENLSGVWETDDGHGGAVGIELTLRTSLPGGVGTSSENSETWQGLQVGVFHRLSSEIRLGDENYFTDSPQGGNVRYEDGKLTLHLPWADLDLKRLPEGGWSGRLHRNDFDRSVVLTQMQKPLQKISPFVGTWRLQQDGARFSCLHIVQTGADAFSGWEDFHVTPGLLRYASTIERPLSVTAVRSASPCKIARHCVWKAPHLRLAAAPIPCLLNCKETRCRFSPLLGTPGLMIKIG
jgi:hypothetical protein